jgi:hypothetical protein
LGTVGGEAQLGAALGVGLEVFDGDIDTGRKDAGDGFEMGAATAPVCCRPWPRPGLGDAEVVVADMLDELQGVGRTGRAGGCVGELGARARARKTEARPQRHARCR